jgi:hypothetical protein
MTTTARLWLKAFSTDGTTMVGHPNWPDFKVHIFVMKDGDVALQFMRSGKITGHASRALPQGAAPGSFVTLEEMVGDFPELAPLLVQELDAGLMRAGLSAHSRLSIKYRLDAAIAAQD